MLTILLASCTGNEMAKQYGGSTELILPAGQKLVTVTWKGDDLWYATRPMKSTDSTEVYKFSESSNFGILEGTVIIKETR